MEIFTLAQAYKKFADSAKVREVNGQFGISASLLNNTFKQFRFSSKKDAAHALTLAESVLLILAAAECTGEIISQGDYDNTVATLKECDEFAAQMKE